MQTIIQQEIILMTGTSFSSRQCWQKTDNSQNYSETEHLLEACWNGLLPDMLPEICEQAGNHKKLYLWQIKENKSSIEIDLGEVPDEIEKEFSIDPYSILDVQLMN